MDNWIKPYGYLFFLAAQFPKLAHNLSSLAYKLQTSKVGPTYPYTCHKWPSCCFPIPARTILYTNHLLLMTMAFTIASSLPTINTNTHIINTQSPCADRSCTPRYKLRNTHKLKAGKAVSSVCEPLPADRPVWFPGTTPPEWLDGRSILFFFSFFYNSVFIHN